jgi:hypothetical protein
MRKVNSASEHQTGTLFFEENRLVPMAAPNPTYNCCKQYHKREATVIVYDALKGSSQAVED